jgi:hypothetical protein
MTDQTPPRRTAAARPRRSLYRTVLSLGIAAIAATWLPFSFLYLNSLNHRSPAVATLTAPSATGARTTTLTPVTTRVSGAPVSTGTPAVATGVAASPASAQTVAPTPVVTRSS